METLKEALFSRKNLAKSINDGSLSLYHKRFRSIETLYIEVIPEDFFVNFSVLTAGEKAPTECVLSVYDINGVIEALSSKNSASTFSGRDKGSSLTIDIMADGYPEIDVLYKNSRDSFKIANSDELNKLLNFLENTKKDIIKGL